MLGLLLASATGGAATSQSWIDNDQSQSGDVLADGALDVVDVDEVDQTVTSAANGYTAQVEDGQMTVTSSQVLSGTAAASNRIGVASYAYRVGQTATAAGNAGQTDSLGYGDMDVVASQRLDVVDVAAANTLDAAGAQVDNIAATAQATGNAHAVSQVGASSLIQIDQQNAGLVQADGAYQFRHSTGPAAFTATAAANNVTGAGVDGAEQDIIVDQTMNGARIQASQWVAAANAQEITAASAAIANNLTASNGDNRLTVVARQTNAAYVRAESDVYAYDFGAATAQAIGAANVSAVGQAGPEITVDIDQLNSSGVDVLASFNGARGYDGHASATAIGNTSTAYACTTCGEARMTIDNAQSNAGPINARSQVSVSQDNRRVSSVATAAGNNATYYVSASRGD